MRSCLHKVRSPDDFSNAHEPFTAALKAAPPITKSKVKGTPSRRERPSLDLSPTSSPGRPNFRLVVSFAKKQELGWRYLFEVVSDGNMHLRAAIEKFDYTRGNKFSTYACTTLIRNFA